MATPLRCYVRHVLVVLSVLVADVVHAFTRARSRQGRLEQAIVEPLTVVEHHVVDDDDERPTDPGVEPCTHGARSWVDCDLCSGEAN